LIFPGLSRFGREDLIGQQIGNGQFAARSPLAWLTDAEASRAHLQQRELTRAVAEIAALAMSKMIH
jgi:hypothetical protein